jgi:16S rRNA C1402 (ribose-2'-O) methylase RsmI
MTTPGLLELQQVVDDLRHRHAALDEREQRIARWHEEATMDERVRLAEQLGAHRKQGQLVLLIDAQLEQLHQGSMDSCLLRALRKQVEGKEP